jgi:hypothetical protein
MKEDIERRPGYEMRIINYLFGEKPATRATKAIFYIAWLSMLTGFLGLHWSWLNLSMPLVGLSFFTIGIFMTFTGKDSLVDFWRPNTRLGRELLDPAKGKRVMLSMRMVGIAFMVGILYVTYVTFHR